MPTTIPRFWSQLTAAMAPAPSLKTSLLLLASLSLVILSDAQNQKPPIVKGLSWGFYQKSCPSLEPIVRKNLQKFLRKDIGIAAGLLRLHNHDCFVQGCEGSVLLAGSAAGPGEQTAIPNLSLRKEAFQIIDSLRDSVHKRCGQIVSCSDILALAARDSVLLSGGPNYAVPLGRRDSTTLATVEATLANLPSPFSSTTVILSDFSKKGFNVRETVALSGGGHTIGRAHCPTFANRLIPTQDPTMDNAYADILKRTCPTTDSNNTAMFDIRSPNLFDNKYFVNLVNRQGLLKTDQDLFNDERTSGIVASFAANQTLFFEEFVSAVVKMSQLSVLTGSEGEIRSNCSAMNSNNNNLESFVDRHHDSVVEEGVLSA